jgi:hypothetical protein
MAEKYLGCATDTNDSLQDKVRAIDLGMTWLRPSNRRSLQSSARWIKIEQELIDLHARYERACIED